MPISNCWVGVLFLGFYFLSGVLAGMTYSVEGFYLSWRLKLLAASIASRLAVCPLETCASVSSGGSECRSGLW